jgi:hypothetical protein
VPLVLTQNEMTESGHTYADVLGQRYEYPPRYRGLIRPGRRFVYYRGRRTIDGRTRPQVYLGSGLIGPTGPSRTPGRLVCQIEDYVPFGSPVLFKDGAGYLEPGAGAYGAKAGLFFRSGVREIDAASFRRILETAAAEAIPEIPSGGSRYASPENARLVDEVAMEVAIAHLASEWPAHEIKTMPHNNPGYDLEVVKDGHLIRYAEIKGTRKRIPEYFISEGQRLFAGVNSQRHTLVVVYSVDIAARTGVAIACDGAIETNSDLRPDKWIGVVRGFEQTT